jgi:ureidoglycolate lyase
MLRVRCLPLTAEAFAPFGEVIERPADYGRVYFSEALANGCEHAKPSLSIAHLSPFEASMLEAIRMERHEFSSQSFVPIDVARYLVIVAPHGPDGKPDSARLQAFLARGDQGVTYGMNVWHHPMTVLDRPGKFAVFMWLAGGDGDEEFVDLPAAIAIDFPPASIGEDTGYAKRL